MSDLRQLSAADFPTLLHEIPDPPKKLWLRGDIPSGDRKLLTVVGSRRMTPYGKQACEHIIRGLANTPIAIVSGLALGTDAQAHRVALDVGLPTIAVPGSGLDWNVVYPRSHERLAREIVDKGGALLSEYEPSFRATIWSFPRRNRIMAGMSHATLIIEAELKSGTLITMRLAADYNREVMAVPGHISSAFSRGPHMLIKKGAALVENADDVLEVLGLKRAEARSAAMPPLSSSEQKVWDILSSPQSKDNLLRNLKLPIGEAQALLAVMEIKGYIKEELGEMRRM